MGFHHQSCAAARHMRDDGCAPVQFDDGAQIDGKGQINALAGSQTQACGAQKHTGCTQVDGLTQAASSLRQQDVDGGAGTVACM